MSKPVFTPVESIANTLVNLFFAAFILLCVVIFYCLANGIEAGTLALLLFIDCGLMWLASMFQRSDAGR